jgi:ribonuclease HI
MSVKGFIDKYFKPTTIATPQSTPPIHLLEPMVGLVLRDQVDRPRVMDTTPSDVFHIFTDGACSDNGRRGARGGFGVHVYSDTESRLDISQALNPSEPQTNNRAELRAIEAACNLIDNHGDEWRKTHTRFTIWTDSEYSINSLTKWAQGWKANGWKKRDAGPIVNLDLIQPLYTRLSKSPHVSLRYVKGHQDAKGSMFPWCGNIVADKLATDSIHRVSN